MKNMNTNSKVVLTSISAFASLSCLSIPGFNILVPLVLWLVWRDEDPEFGSAAKVIVNSQISWSIWLIISLLLCFLLTFVLIGFILIWIMPLLWIIFTIRQAVKMSNGDYSYKMPMTISFLK